MSRHPVTVRSSSATDEDAIIGYDPPLRTYFLQAFEDDETEVLRLWLGTRLEEYPSLRSLLDAVRARGFYIHGLTLEVICEMDREATAPHSPSLAERSGWPLD